MIRRFVMACMLVASTAAIAHAAVSKSDTKSLDTASSNQSGPGMSSATSGRRNQSTVGAGFSSVTISGGRFRVQPGFLAAALGAAAGTPPGELDITVLYAKTTAFGSDITPQAWQLDADPVFLWQPPASGVDLAGYSYAVGSEPNDTIDTTGTSWDVAMDPVQRFADGKHVFQVKAINSAGNVGEPASIEVWVDTTPPTIGGYAPASGVLLNTLSPAITATVADASSGVNASSVAVLINGSQASVTLNPATGAVTASGAGPVREGSNRVELRASDALGNAAAPLVWTFSVDATAPEGAIVINGGRLKTTSVYVTLGLEADDAVSGIAGMLLSNDPSVGYVQEPFAATRELWRLNAVKGVQKVYVKFIDGAGNISQPFVDEIELDLLAPDTLILSGPSGLSPERSAEFVFGCPEENCVFSYAFDHDDWSEWSSEMSVTRSSLSLGNHYIKVKAAKDVNGVPGIQEDEEDPTPAERTWIVGVEPSLNLVPRGAPIKLWRLE